MYSVDLNIIELNKAHRVFDFYIESWETRLSILEEFVQRRRGSRFLGFGQQPASSEELKNVLRSLQSINRKERLLVRMYASSLESAGERLTTIRLACNDIPNVLLSVIERARGDVDAVIALHQAYAPLISQHRAVLEVEKRLLESYSAAVVDSYFAAVHAFAVAANELTPRIEAFKPMKESFDAVVKAAATIESERSKMTPNMEVLRSAVSGVFRVGASNSSSALVLNRPIDANFLKLTFAIYVSVVIVNIIDYRWKTFTRLTNRVVKLVS